MLSISSLLPVDQVKIHLSKHKISQFLCCILVFELLNIMMQAVSLVVELLISSRCGGPSQQGQHFGIMRKPMLEGMHK